MSDGHDYDAPWEQEEAVCPTCDGDGEENLCVDDLCAGLVECIHGDGMIPCRTCGGGGYI